MNHNKFESEEEDRSYWEQPDKYVLVKRPNLPAGMYATLKLDPRLFMTIFEDNEDAKIVSEKMIKNGVRVFESFEVFLEWYKIRNK